MKIFSKQSLSNGVKNGLTVLISVLIIFTVVQAGTITPPSGVPSAKFYTTSEIYNFIINNTAATESSHSFAFSDNLEGTGRTLAEIYNALTSLISANKVKLGTTYLGTAGTLVSSGGTAGTSDVFNGKTFFGVSQTDWNTQAGALNLACNTATFNGTANKVADAYDGGGNGNNRWCMTDSGDAVTGDILSGKVAWVDGVAVTGNVAAGSNVTGDNGSLSFTIPDGLYSSSKTATANDTNLTAGNIKSGITIFGVTGIYAGSGPSLPDTGLTSSYTATFGEDHNYTSSNSAHTCNLSYTDNTNGTITDNCTGLVWMKCSRGQTYNAGTGACDGIATTVNREGALSYCEGLTLASQSDWRLPNVKELLSITDLQPGESLQAPINGTYFPSTVLDKLLDFYYNGLRKLLRELFDCPGVHR